MTSRGGLKRFAKMTINMKKKCMTQQAYVYIQCMSPKRI